MTTHNSLAGSHRQIKMQYRWQIITLPTSVLHRHSNWPDCKFSYNPEVSLSRICFIALCYCHTFCQIFLAPYLCFNVMFQHFFTFTLKRAGTSLRTYLVAPHILTSCMQKYSVVKVQGAYAAISEWKGTMLTACYATSKANIFVISFVSNLRRRVSSMQ